MKHRTYRVDECNLRIEEFEEVVAGCDETIALIDQLLDRTYGADDAMEARMAILRVRADADRARGVWMELRRLA